LVGEGWRSNLRPVLEGLAPSEVGIVRGERNVMREASMPGTINRIAWRFGIQETFCGAKALRPSEASFVALCEAIERHHVVYRPPGEPLIYSTYAELGEAAINPGALFYRLTGNGPGSSPIAYSEYDISTPLYWTWAHNPLNSEARLVPAQEVWFNTGLLP